jgi:Tol biopolymer transport system component
VDKTRILGSLCLAAVLLLAVACGAGGSQGPTPTTIPLVPTSTPELATPSPTMEPTEPPAPTPTATESPAPTATPTQQPTATPTPWPTSPAPTPTPGLQARFVFQVGSGGDIYMVNADRSGLRRLTRGMDPSWSPDGQQVVFVRWTEPWGIYIINADGSNERLLFSSSVARSPVFSPDGSQIAFFFTTEGWHPAWKIWIDGFGWYYIERGYKQTEWHLGVVNVADGSLREPYCDNLSFSPTWTVDGEQLVYDGIQGLMISEANGANNVPFTDNPQDHFPVMSPEGTQVAMQHWQHDHWEIYATGANGVGRWPLTSSSPLLDRRPNNVSPTWSPDGKQIAFLSDRSGEWEFYVMDADGTNQRKILGNVTQQLKIYYTGGNERVLSWGR